MFKALFTKDVHFDGKMVTLTVVSTLLIMLDYYQPFSFNKPFERFFLYLVIPLGIIIFAFREHPKEYGFCFGDWKAGLFLTMGGAALMTPVIWLLARSDASIQRYYQNWLVPNLIGWNVLELLGWEFLFRGWLLFGYARKYGPDALWLQAVPFALAHIGKPGIETFSTIFGGFAFGWVAWRTRSFLYPCIIHWFIATLIVLIAAGVLGVK
jgi:membrane protease YdiL (CAAX protease family)